MLGWTLVFMLMSFTAALAGTAHGVGFVPSTTAVAVFGFLLLASLLTRALRGQD
jgi:hypothetical protein